MGRQELVGTVGSVTHRIRGGERPGEVRVVIGGLPQHYLAFAPVEVPVGTPVLIVHLRGSRQVDVEPWAR